MMNMFKKKKQTTNVEAPVAASTCKFGMLVFEVTYKNKAKRIENRIVKYDGEAPLLADINAAMDNFQASQPEDGVKIDRVAVVNFFQVIV